MSKMPKQAQVPLSVQACKCIQDQHGVHRSDILDGYTLLKNTQSRFGKYRVRISSTDLQMLLNHSDLQNDVQDKPSTRIGFSIHWTEGTEYW